MLSYIQYHLPTSSNAECIPAGVEVVDELLQRLSNTPRHAMWGQLLSFAQHDGITTVKSLEIYEAALRCFPSTPALQVAHIKKALCSNSNYTPEQIMNFFDSYLKQPSVAICTLYVSFVRDQFRTSSIQETYRLVLNLVGQEYESHELWTQYLDLLEQEGDRQALRKALYEVVKIPTKSLPHFWTRLQHFERSGSGETQDFGPIFPAHTRALIARHQIEHYTELLYPPPVAGPHYAGLCGDTLLLPASPIASFSDGQLVQHWEAYLRWEESDPLKLKESNMAAYIQQLQSAYHKGSVRLRFCPELWYMEYKWWNSIGRDTKAIDRLQEGIEANKASVLMNLALADALEARGDLPSAARVYKELLHVITTSLDLDSIALIRPIDVSKDLTVVYLMLMRFTYRTQGVPPAQFLVGHSANGPSIPCLVYEEAARMEIDCGGSKASALQVFEAGMLYYSNDRDFLVSYLGWLISVNKRNFACGLFESASAKFSPSDAAPIWDLWSRYMYRCGDLESIQQLERRMAKIYGSVDLRLSLAQLLGGCFTFTRDVTKSGVAGMNSSSAQAEKARHCTRY
ncbi:mRNA 3'-end-processing protein rna14 [Paramarasmius palmivorus]|uniref:mRNA 3'-end-processing protein RNA14 n=1 Tax=Paramarasmius palmivorus TaxID=297713 RepID=A0AAW0BCI9_9AGAR